MRRPLVLGSAFALAAVLPLAVATHPSFAATSTTWVTSATKAEVPALVGAKLLGAVAPNTTLQITVGLKPRNTSSIQTTLKSMATPGSALYGHSMTPAQVAATFGATSTQVQAVVSYLQSKGMTNVTALPDNLAVTADANVVQAQSAFDTPILSYIQNGKTIYANLGAAQVPSTLAGDVSGVLGLTNAGKMVGPPTIPSPTGYLKEYNPQDFMTAYDAHIATGQQTPIAIFAEGDLTQVVKDLRLSESLNRLPQVPVSIIKTGVSSTDTAGQDEWDMDTQFSSGFADGVKTLYIYDATSLTDSDLALSFASFANHPVARAGSASFGECEYQAYLDGSMVVDDMFFAQAALQGQTVFASSGDTGGFCPVAPTNGAPGGVPVQNYPTSSPYVVSVGGTSLFTNPNNTYQDEIAWVAGGGGPSAFEFQPYWQNGITPPTSLSCAQVVACLGKNDPDIAMDADPESGANVYISGTPTGVGGTSLASPLALGGWARLESAHSNTLGFASPLLYGAYGTKGFHDITEGDTGPYPAIPGWDYATGIGSYNLAYLNNYIVPKAAPVVLVKLASPACTTAQDPTGDANPLGSTGNVDSMDIEAIGFAPSKTSVVAEMQVKSLNDGPGGTTQLAGDGDNWYVLWKYNGTEYFLSAQYPTGSPSTSNPTSLFSFSYGDLTQSPSGGTLYNTIGSATGTVNTSKGLITISAPFSDFGGPRVGTALTSTSGETFESVGTPAGGLLEAADGAGPGSSYALGASC